MWPLVVVIEQELAHDIAELLNRGDDEMVEAFGLKGLDEGLNVAVGFGGNGAGCAWTCNRYPRGSRGILS